MEMLRNSQCQTVDEPDLNDDVNEDEKDQQSLLALLEEVGAH